MASDRLRHITHVAAGFSQTDPDPDRQTDRQTEGRSWTYPFGSVTEKAIRDTVSS